MSSAMRLCRTHMLLGSTCYAQRSMALDLCCPGAVGSTRLPLILLADALRPAFSYCVLKSM